MSSEGSITQWISRLRSGEEEAAERLWQAYFARMVQHAGGMLVNAQNRSGDEEDAALSAFKSFCFGARDGRFPHLVDRGNLWPLLVAITSNKCVDIVRHDQRQKRGGSGAIESLEFIDVIDREPTPEFVVQLKDELDRLLVRLDATGDLALRSVALWKLDGMTSAEIAAKLGCVRRTVERKLQLIAEVWEAG